MAQAKQASKRKRVNTSLPVLGAAGVSLAVAGGASATAPTANVQDTGSRTVITLSEEEIADVNLATFYVFDKEDARIPQAGVQLAWRGCRGPVEPVEPVGSAEPAEAAAAVAVRRGELVAGARCSTLRLRYALTTLWAIGGLLISEFGRPAAGADASRCRLWTARWVA